MIEIKRDKELIRVECMDEVFLRPGFNTNLDPTKHTLDSIIGRYVEREKVVCGLSNCHTPHLRGYVVSTKDGQETNIGKDCGKKHFGVDFVTLSRQFDRDITEKENRDKLWSFSFQLDILKERVQGLRSEHHGADWVKAKTSALMMPIKGCSDVIQAIGKMVRARQNVLRVDRPASEEEASRIEVAQGRKLPRPYFIPDDIANIAGIEALYPENDLRALLVIELEQPIQEFDNLNIDTLNYTSLEKWVKWMQSVEQTLDRATESVDYGRRLLDVINLAPFENIINNRQDVASFKRFLKSLTK
ncbi:MAG: hypothetical protein ACYC3O_07655 [Burkholderiales bacterium]